MKPLLVCIPPFPHPSLEEVGLREALKQWVEMCCLPRPSLRSHKAPGRAGQGGEDTPHTQLAHNCCGSGV